MNASLNSAWPSEHGDMSLRTVDHVGAVWHSAPVGLHPSQDTRIDLVAAGDEPFTVLLGKIQTALQAHAKSGMELRGTVVTIGILFGEDYWSHTTFWPPEALRYFVENGIGIEFAVYRKDGASEAV